MTETKHTPGTWKTPVGVIEPDKVWSEDENSNEVLIARGIENSADAHLISAAPELLEALIAARAGRSPNHVPLHEMIDAAIAKATGA